MPVDPAAIDPVAATDADLNKVARLTREQIEAEDEVAARTAELRAAIDRLRAISDRELPAALAAAGLTEITTTGGHKVKIAETVTAGKLTSSDNPAGMKWALDHGAGDLINVTVTVVLDREDRELGIKIMQSLQKLPAANRFKKLELEESIHNQTMSAFVRRLLPKNPPLELLRAFIVRRARIGDRKIQQIDLKGLEIPE
jgi:hypothetical protein